MRDGCPLAAGPRRTSSQRAEDTEANSADGPAGAVGSDSEPELVVRNLCFKLPGTFDDCSVRWKLECRPKMKQWLLKDRLRRLRGEKMGTRLSDLHKRRLVAGEVEIVHGRWSRAVVEEKNG